MNSTPDHSTLAERVHAQDHILGEPGARVAIVEYADFECPSCAQAAPGLRIVQEHFHPHACLVFRHYPLVDIHPHAMAAAEAAEAAAAQGRFWVMHDLLFRYQLHLGRERLLYCARRAALDMVQFERELDAGTYRGRVEADVKSGRASRVMSTPALFVNGELCDVSFGLHRLHELLERVLAATSR